MDPLSIAIGGVLLLVGYFAGRKHRRAVVPPPPQAICQCRHGLQTHDETGRCCEKELLPVKWDSWGSPTSYDEFPCECRKYIGPRPVEDFFSTPLLPPADAT